jgi:hypothetical protein
VKKQLKIKNQDKEEKRQNLKQLKILIPNLSLNQNRKKSFKNQRKFSSRVPRRKRKVRQKRRERKLLKRKENNH